MVTISFGSLFHSVIVLGKKENLKISLCPFGTINLKLWLPSVLFSLFGIKQSSHFPSSKPQHIFILFQLQKKKTCLPRSNLSPVECYFCYSCYFFRQQLSYFFFAKGVKCPTTFSSYAKITELSRLLLSLFLSISEQLASIVLISANVFQIRSTIMNGMNNQLGRYKPP